MILPLHYDIDLTIRGSASIHSAERALKVDEKGKKDLDYLMRFESSACAGSF